jgi:recombinational DNA repair protein RecR
MSNTGRTEDIKELYHQLERTPNKGTREDIRRTISLIKNESGAVKSMRESLVKAHRNSDYQEVKDIHDFVKNKRQYKNE